MRKIHFQGYISYQNKLNSLNKPFFDVCDGIFINYSWSCGDLADSISALKDDSRRKDIFVGVDVWGRGTYGGGQFHCDLVICQYWSIVKPRPQTLSPKTPKPKTKGPWADTKNSWAINLTCASLSKYQHSG